METTSFVGNWVIKDASVIPEFFALCEEVVNNEELFKRFKRIPTFCHMIGNDTRTKAQADMLYKHITKKPKILSKMELFKTNDKYGSPFIYVYPDLGAISPGILFFMNVLDSMINYFGDIDNFNILEIGSGYGGQAKIILDYGCKSYTCIDDFRVLNLCKKYLNLFNYRNLTFYEMDKIAVKEYDLVISNWCFSELDFIGIKWYIENVISKCKYGYFLMNMWDSERKEYTMELMKKYFSYVEALPIVPLTDPYDNWLLVVKKEGK